MLSTSFLMSASLEYVMLKEQTNHGTNDWPSDRPIDWPNDPPTDRAGCTDLLSTTALLIMKDNHAFYPWFPREITIPYLYLLLQLAPRFLPGIALADNLDTEVVLVALYAFLRPRHSGPFQEGGIRPLRTGTYPMLLRRSPLSLDKKLSL